MLPDRPVGLFYAWWNGDPLPEVSALPAMTIEENPAEAEIKQVVDLSSDEISQRLTAGNRAFIARIDGEPAGIGWSSAGRVEIGELGLVFALPAGNRYLWDFVTLPVWRGKRIYPLLLQAFVRREGGVERFWVGHDLDNIASARGIIRAGFLTVGEVFAVPGTGHVFVAGHSAAPARARPAAELLGIPLLESTA